MNEQIRSFYINYLINNNNRIEQNGEYVDLIYNTMLCVVREKYKISTQELLFLKEECSWFFEKEK